MRLDLALTRLLSFVSRSEGGFFKAKLSFPPDYPFAPPTMRFVSEMWHPNSMSTRPPSPALARDPSPLLTPFSQSTRTAMCASQSSTRRARTRTSTRTRRSAGSQSTPSRASSSASSPCLPIPTTRAPQTSTPPRSGEMRTPSSERRFRTPSGEHWKTCERSATAEDDNFVMENPQGHAPCLLFYFSFLGFSY